MTILATPPTFYQFGEPSVDHNEMCGQCAVASALVALKLAPSQPDAALTVDAWLRAQPAYATTLATGGTSVAALGAALDHFGASAHTSTDYAAIAAGVGRGRYVIALVASDHLGHPVPTYQAATYHWVLVYGVDGGSVQIANSGSGNLESYADAYFAESFANATLEVIPPQENIVTDADIARGDIYAVRAALIGDGPGSPNESAAIEAYVAATVASPESGLSALIADCQKDGRYVPGRVAALEAWSQSFAAAVQAELAKAPAPVAAPDTSALEAQVTSLQAAVAALTARLGAAKLEI